MGGSALNQRSITQEESDKLATLKDIHFAFEGKAPLWYYILAEAP